MNSSLQNNHFLGIQNGRVFVFYCRINLQKMSHMILSECSRTNTNLYQIPCIINLVFTNIDSAIFPRCCHSYMV